MKKILLIICVAALFLVGCNYILPRTTSGGKVDISKINKEITPSERGGYWEIIIEPIELDAKNPKNLGDDKDEK